ncbi:TRAP transporter TAXI family solute receptor [Neorhizobium huautlense]|uniref:TRAP transporter TAXI family solute receptor n=1 Tax=Neorhizobium huautlense TaxID=67774 RepID=A0ABT9PQ80_9HYPH|nr:TAXI family TRAP transporter solute-binding subunit [Neorhizobium huautlense]MDP9836627.1 TRAP transporter TAXI family solute receptor [Neorhizobium huautlense]
MKFAVLNVVALSLIGAVAPQSASAQEPDRQIMAAGVGSTQGLIAQDIAKLGDRCGLPLSVVSSKGALESFFGVRNRRNTQFGVVDSDLLNYLSAYKSESSDVRDAVQGMRVMLPLYDAEVHVLAPDNIRTLQDLRGKRIGVGEKDSTAYLTSQLMFDILRIPVAERVTGTTDEMIELLRQGEIDALVRVAGAPLAALTDPRIDDTYHLVPITDELLRASYKQVTIPANMYPYQRTAVQTVAVKTLLMTYEYGTNKNAYYNTACKAVADFTNLVVDNIDELRRTGHPKWKDIDLTEVPKGWEVGMCVRKGLDPTYKVSCTNTSDNVGNNEYLNLLEQHMKR